MPDPGAVFQSIPPDYRKVIDLAQEQHNIAITPLLELVGGWSGAVIYLVSVTAQDSGQVKHLILKVDRKRPMASSDEIARHQQACRESPEEFARQHIPDMLYERVEAEGAIAIFYAIAGQSLHNFRTLSNFSRQDQLEKLFAATNGYLLDEWNADRSIAGYGHPQELMKKWLGFRLQPGQNIEAFLREVCEIHPETPGFLIEGHVFPNPLLYARDPQPWGGARPGDALIGLQHSDLNTNNILAQFSPSEEELVGFYLIDFALFKQNMPLLYDLRYLEMSYLVHAISQGSFNRAVELVAQLGEYGILEAHQVPVEMAGVNAAIRAARVAFERWVQDRHTTLQDDLWGQYWLAGAAAGLSYCHKSGQEDEVRLAGLIYAAANLKQFLNRFGLPMPAEASQLYEKGQVAQAARGGAGARRPKHNLPAAPTNFVGRSAELAALTDLLGQPGVRLITLTGPGGTGKTRLGLETARAMLDQFSDGVYFVDLAPLSDPALFATTAAHTMGVREGGGRPPVENLKDYLSDRRLLLLFDNFEQIAEAAGVVAELLQAAPDLKVLATSRVALRLRGEREFPVSPLETPADDSQALAEILGFEAVALFRQQAQAVRPDFEITEENRADVVEICRRLDGLPLAIEIAAARLKMLPPEALLKRLSQSLKVLVGGARDLPDRQQTLRRTIDWSYELLQPEEQMLFSRLGIFVGGFSLEAADGVCNSTGEIDVFSGVEALFNNSLLRRVTGVGDEPRFDMLQTIREYALGKTAEAGALEAMREAHCQYYFQLASGEMGPGIGGSESEMWLQRIDEEHDNFRVALSWALEDKERIPLAIMIMTTLTWFWYRYGHLHEGSEWTERALEVTEGFGDTPLRALALTGRGYLAMWKGDLIVAAQRSREAVEMSERLRFDQGIAMAKLGYGTTLIQQGRDREAYPHLVDAAELFDQQDQLWTKGASMVHLANVSLGLGDPDQALKWLDIAVPVMEQSGDIWSMAFALSNYGEVARALGDYQKAEAYYRQTQALYEQADAKGDQARLVSVFGYLAQHKGDLEEARSLFLESLNDFLELGNHRGIAECLAGLAGLASEQGRHKWAVPLLSAAESQLKAFGGAWWPADRVEIERARERLQAALGSEFESLWAEGQAMGVDEAIAYASAGG